MILHSEFQLIFSKFVDPTENMPQRNLSSVVIHPPLPLAKVSSSHRPSQQEDPVLQGTPWLDEDRKKRKKVYDWKFVIWWCIHNIQKLLVKTLMVCTLKAGPSVISNIKKIFLEIEFQDIAGLDYSKVKKKKKTASLYLLHVCYNVIIICF